MKKGNILIKLLIWMLVVASYNAILFLLIDVIDQEILAFKTFWFSYIVMMVALIIWLLVMIFSKTTKLGAISLLPTITHIFVMLIFLITTFLCFLAKKVNINIAIVCVIVVSVLYLITGILTVFYQKKISYSKTFPEKLLKIEDAITYLKTLQTNTSFQTNIDELISNLNTLETNLDSEEIKSIDKQLLEHISFLGCEINNGEDTNVNYHFEKCKKLLKERIAKQAKK